MLFMLANMLSSFTTVLTAESAEDALKLMESVTPDLLVLDQRMPKMTGSEMVRTLRERKQLPPTILFSGYIQDLKDDCWKGLAHVVKKPEVEELVSAVKTALKMPQDPKLVLPPSVEVS